MTNERRRWLTKIITYYVLVNSDSFQAFVANRTDPPVKELHRRRHPTPVIRTMWSDFSGLRQQHRMSDVRAFNAAGCHGGGVTAHVVVNTHRSVPWRRSPWWDPSASRRDLMGVSACQPNVRMVAKLLVPIEVSVLRLSYSTCQGNFIRQKRTSNRILKYSTHAARPGGSAPTRRAMAISLCPRRDRGPLKTSARASRRTSRIRVCIRPYTRTMRTSSLRATGRTKKKAEKTEQPTAT